MKRSIERTILKSEDPEDLQVNEPRSGWAAFTAGHKGFTLNFSSAVSDLEKI